MSSKDKHVVFYDGVCRLCNRTVQFVLRIDRDRVLLFAPLQGAAAERFKQDPNSADLKTLLFVENYGTDHERVSSRSTGVLRMLARVGGVWRVVSWLRVVPAPLRDFAYRIVARYRYRWFGRFDSCEIPRNDDSARFLD